MEKYIYRYVKITMKKYIENNKQIAEKKNNIETVEIFFLNTGKKNRQ